MYSVCWEGTRNSPRLDLCHINTHNNMFIRPDRRPGEKIERFRSLGRIAYSCLFKKKKINPRLYILKGFGWNNVDPAWHMAAQHDINIGPMYGVIWVVVFLLFQCWASVELWVEIKRALCGCHVLADVLAQSIQQTQCWISVRPAS